jgi:hypothetical protein
MEEKGTGFGMGKRIYVLGQYIIGDGPAPFAPLINGHQDVSRLLRAPLGRKLGELSWSCLAHADPPMAGEPDTQSPWTRCSAGESTRAKNTDMVIEAKKHGMPPLTQLLPLSLSGRVSWESPRRRRRPKATPGETFDTGHHGPWLEIADPDGAPHFDGHGHLVIRRSKLGMEPC